LNFSVGFQENVPVFFPKTGQSPKNAFC
jgi:hypothetical protein